jgi:hypothetical protein
MKSIQEPILRYDDLKEIEKNIFDKYSDIKEAYDALIKYSSNPLAHENCCMTYKGLEEYKSYHKNSLKIIHETCLDLALETYGNPIRRKNRTLGTIILNELGGALGELTAAYEYGLKWEDFLEQLKGKKTYTSYDLLIKGKKVEVKTVHYRFLYDLTETGIPVDTANDTIKHPKYWKREKGKFDFTVLCYVWKGRYRLMHEVTWYVYDNISFFYGTGAGVKGDFFRRKMKKDPSLKYKIMVPINDDYLNPPGTYLSLREA